MTTDVNAALYAERQALITAAMDLEAPDRIPIVFSGEAFAPRFVGMSLARYCNEDAAPIEANLEAFERLGGYDGMNSVVGGQIGPLLSSGWLQKVRVPGIDLPEDEPWQVDETGTMAVEDYERILEEGWDSVYESLLPRVVDMERLSATFAWFEEQGDATVTLFREHGIPIMSSGGIITPFETLCGARSLSQFYMDLYRRPELVKKAMQVMLPGMLEMGVGLADTSGVPCTWIGGWRSSGGMLSEATWLEFVFPQLRVIAESLVAAGVRPILHFDHDWTRVLPHLRRLPAGRCVLQLDGMTDIRAAKEVLGGHMAIMGDVPPTLLASGTPGEVRAYVRDLIRDVGPDGFLLAPGCDAPVNAKPENMQALCDAGREFGGG